MTVQRSKLNYNMFFFVVLKHNIAQYKPHSIDILIDIKYITILFIAMVSSWGSTYIKSTFDIKVMLDCFVSLN